jgi:hypothetical protein
MNKKSKNKVFLDQTKQKLDLLNTGNPLNNKIKKIKAINYLSNQKILQMTEYKVVFLVDKHKLVLYFQIMLLNQVYLVLRPKKKLIYLILKVNKNQVYLGLHLSADSLQNNNLQKTH